MNVEHLHRHPILLIPNPERDRREYHSVQWSDASGQPGKVLFFTQDATLTQQLSAFDPWQAVAQIDAQEQAHFGVSPGGRDDEYPDMKVFVHAFGTETVIFKPIRPGMDSQRRDTERQILIDNLATSSRYRPEPSDNAKMVTAKEGFILNTSFAQVASMSLLHNLQIGNEVAQKYQQKYHTPLLTELPIVGYTNIKGQKFAGYRYYRGYDFNSIPEEKVNEFLRYATALQKKIISLGYNCEDLQFLVTDITQPISEATTVVIDLEFLAPLVPGTPRTGLARDFLLGG